MAAADVMRRAWWWLTRTFVGRLLLLSAAVKAIVWASRAATRSTETLNGVDSMASVLLVIAAAILGYRAYVHVKRVMLWRVRRKLTLSYVFIGFVPALLLIVFFSISGLLLFFNVGAYMLRSKIDTLVERTQAIAQTAVADLEHVRGGAETGAALVRHQQRANATLPLVSFAVIPSSAACAAGARSVVQGPVAVAGPWGHTVSPALVPEWVSCAGYAGLVAGINSTPATTSSTAPSRSPSRALSGTTERPWVAARAVAWMDRDGVREAVIVDVPLGDALLNSIADETGVTVQSLRLFDQVEGPFGATEPSATALSGTQDTPANGGAEQSAPGKAPANAAQPRVGADEPRTGITLGPVNVSLGNGAASRGPLRWAAFIDYTAWDTGKPDSLFVQIGLGVRAVYERLSAAPVARLTDFSFAQLLLVGLAIVAALFLVILAVAFLVGFVLARSITGAVHELFEGTERVRGGDFKHKIVLRSRDQLGELADSFNSMTASIEDLLQQKAQKERLEQELRIAREIQMSLLPQASLTFGGVSFAGHCEPAREVGGDYYDYWAIDDHRFGILIADVAGKGTSAALYMAELKGIVLSFSQSHMSPRRLLIDANRIISNHLDTRRFITMIYGVVDVRERTLTYARAGHCPLIRLPGPGASSQAAEVLAPDGLVLGLNLDDGQTFERLLEEAVVPFLPGDVFLLYTDGLTEAMNAAGDFYGEDRLSAIVQANGAASFPDLRDAILAAISLFVGPVEQQDDMTMLLLRVQQPEQAAA